MRVETLQWKLEMDEKVSEVIRHFSPIIYIYIYIYIMYIMYIYIYIIKELKNLTSNCSSLLITYINSIN